MIRLSIGAAALAVAVSMSCGQAGAQSMVPCASEGGYCSVPYPTTVIYGARGYNSSREVRGGIPCTNAAFGDPAPGLGKRCFFIARERGYDRRERYDRDERRRPDRY